MIERKSVVVQGCGGVVIKLIRVTTFVCLYVKLGRYSGVYDGVVGYATSSNIRSSAS